MTKILFGTGVLSWPAEERRSDRYGLVGLLSHVGGTFLPLIPVGIGTRGTLRAVVRDTRVSHHIGDLTHGFFPSTPKIGEVIGLGVGTLFYEAEDGRVVAATSTEACPYVGLKPSEERSHFWLDPPALYRCHDQTVTLWLVEEE